MSSDPENSGRDSIGSWLQGQGQWSGRGPEFKYEPAPLLSRVIALCLDWAVASIISLGFFESDPLATLVIFFVQYVVLGSTLGASFGQFLLRLRVLSVNGRRAIIWQILIRTVMLMLIVPAVIWDANGRGLHDIAARTVIIRRP